MLKFTTSLREVEKYQIACHSALILSRAERAFRNRRPSCRGQCRGRQTSSFEHETNDVILNKRVFGALVPLVDSTAVGTTVRPVRRRRTTVTLSTIDGMMANATAFRSYVVVCFVWGCVCEIH